MQKIIEYKLLGFAQRNELEKAVNEHIKDGWVPQGGIAVAQGNMAHSGGYVQAMVKYGE